MLRLYLVRHGQTDWNMARRYLGSSDIQLNAQGRQQALDLAEVLANITFTRCYSSDLSRTKETALEILTKRQLKPVFTSALRELNFGPWEGLTFEQISDRNPADMDAWCKSGGVKPPMGGESLVELELRLQQWLVEVYSDNAEGDVLVVTHGGPLRVLLCLCLGLPSSKNLKFAISPGGLAVVEVVEDYGVLAYFNGRGQYRNKKSVP